MEWIFSVGFRVIRRTFCSYFFFLLSLNTISAQDVVFSFPREKGLIEQRFFYTPSDTLVVFYYQNRWEDVNRIGIFSMTHHELTNWDLPENAQWIGWTEQKGKWYAYYSVWEEQSEMVSFYERQWTGKKFAEPRLLFQYPYVSANRTPRFSLRRRDQSMVFMLKELTYKTKEILSFRLKGEPGQWKFEKSAIWKIEHDWDDWELQRWTIDHNGDILLMTGENRIFRTTEQRASPPHSQIYYYQFDQQHLKEWDMLIGDKVVKEAYWHSYADSLMALGMICSIAGSQSNKGWLRYVINTNRKEVIEQQYTLFEYPKGANEDWIGIEELAEDGNYLGLFGEHFHAEEMRTTDFQTGRIYSNWIFHYDEIYFQLMDSTLQLINEVSVIHKAQEGSDWEGVSFESIINQNGIEVRYNDLEENDPLRESKRAWMGRKSVISRIQWGWNEKYSGQRKVLRQETKKKQGVFVPSKGNRGKYSIWWTINDILICKD